MLALAIFFVLCIGSIGSIFDDAVTDMVDVNVECETYSDLVNHVVNTNGTRISDVMPLAALIPSNARKIQFRGHDAGFLGLGQFVEFSCTISENDFMKFALERGYQIETNRIVNANANSGAIREMEYEDRWNAVSKPDRYLSYTCIFSNNGGISLLYDSISETMYGFYASN